MSGITDWLGVLFIVAVVYVLVRPRSAAGQLVEAVGAALAAMVRAATGQE